MKFFVSFLELCFSISYASAIYMAPVTSTGWNGTAPFLVQVTFGTPPQTLPLMVDSGSKPLQVVGAPFAASLNNGIGGFNVTSSTTWVNATSAIPASQIVYGSASFAVTFGYDSVAFGNFHVPNTTVAIVNQLLSGSPPQGFSGAVGMAWQNYTTPCVSYVPSCILPSVIAAAVAGGNPPLWTIYLTAASNFTTGGLNIGTIDSSQYTGSITYTSVIPSGISQSKWYVYMNQISVNGIPVACQNGNCSMHPDTGTTGAIIFPSTAIVVAISQALNATQACTLSSCADNSSAWNGTNWGWPCSASLASLPSFTLDFNGSSIVVPPTIYLGPKQIMKRSGWCSLGSPGIFEMEAKGKSQITAGKPVIERYYNVFDVGNAQYGFAPVVGLPSNLAG